MNAGDLKYRITFQKFIISTNDNGFEVEAWEDYIILWARVENLHGREYFEAAAIQAEKTVKFTTRYFKSIDESMRIKFREKFYNITFIDNIKYGNRYMEIKALEVEQSG